MGRGARVVAGRRRLVQSVVAVPRTALLLHGLLVFGSLTLACLPPATLELAPAAAEAAPQPTIDPSSCRALIGEVTERGDHVTRELHWGLVGVDERERAGLIVGDADELFAVTLERTPIDPAEFFDDVSEVRCEEPSILFRKLPDGVAQPLVSASAACVGEVSGERFDGESSLAIVSALGPYLGWRSQLDSTTPIREKRMKYGTVDVRNARDLVAADVLEPSETMVRADLIQRGEAESLDARCRERDAPQGPWQVNGFAIDWARERPPILRVAYTCCGQSICELEDPLPSIDAELGARLPDADGLLHSPYGCGSIGLDGQLRSREGASIGRIELDAKRVIGVVFLPVDHPFELDWL